MKKTIIILLLIIFFTNFNICLAQLNQQTEHQINSSIFGKERRIKVFLPKMYQRDSTLMAVPVYVLDAQDEQVWNMVTGQVDYLVSRHSVIPMILIGIVTEHRGKEFLPPSNELIAHFKNEVIPLINSNYRTLSLNVLLGHSLGGSFVSHTLFSDNSNLFNAYIALSPSFDIYDGIIYKNAATMLNSNKDFKSFFYFSSGNIGFELDYKDNVDKMNALLSKNSPKNLVWNTNYFENKDHFSAFNYGLCDGLINLSRQYFTDQKIIEDFVELPNAELKKLITSFNNSKMETFNFYYKPSMGYFKMIGDEFIEKEQFDFAIQIYSLILENEPDNVKTLFNLAVAYDNKEDYKNARDTIIKALKELEVQKSSVSEAYYRDISKWAKSKLDSYN